MKNVFAQLNIFRLMDKKTLKTLGIIAAVMVVFIAVFLVPAIRTSGRLHAKRMEVQNDLVRAEKKIDSYASLSQEKVSGLALIGAVEKRLIYEKDKTKLSGVISDLAKQSDVVIISMQQQEAVEPMPAAYATFYAPLGYELILEAGYHEFGKFLNLLETSAVILKVERFSITPSDDAQVSATKHTITVQLTAYAILQ